MLDFFPAAAIHEKVKSVSLTSTPLFALLIQVSFTVINSITCIQTGGVFIFQYLRLK